MKISFCLITLNEEKNLERCLRSCAALADEIVILDSGSTDGTAEIAKQFNARFEFQQWLGFVGQKNRVMARASNEWIFSIDADEELSPELQQEVAALKRPFTETDTVAYSMPRCVLYDGKWIRHGDWYPDRLVRLFRRTKARFVGAKVHERLEVSGKVEELKADLYHYSFSDAADHWERCQKYARLWAESQHEAGKQVGPLSPHTHAAFRWFRSYLLRRGFLDGEQGKQIAKLSAREVFLKYQTLREMNRATPKRR